MPSGGVPPEDDLHPGAELTAYHASPYAFTQFDPSKIGTGEGAQAFGHGLYFAQHPEVMEEYYQQFKKHPAVEPGNLPHRYEVGLTANHDDFLDWHAPFSQQSPQVQRGLKAVGVGPGDSEHEKAVRARLAHFKQQGLNDNQAAHAIYDELRAEHHAASKPSLADVASGAAAQSPTRKKMRVVESWWDRASQAYEPDPPGETMLRKLINRLDDQMEPMDALEGKGKAQASDVLQRNGIKGVRVLDAGSRGMQNLHRVVDSMNHPLSQPNTRQGAEAALQRLKPLYRDAHVKPMPVTHNYVVFDPNIIKIRRRYEDGGLVERKPIGVFRARGGRIDRSHDVPYLAGASKDGKCTYVDRRVPKTLTVAGKSLDTGKYLKIHEQHEHKLMTGGMAYEPAHRSALKEERKAVEGDGHNWAAYQAHMHRLAHKTEKEKVTDPPKDLYTKPYPPKQAAQLERLSRSEGGRVPATSKAQYRLMAAVKHNPEFAKKAGIPQSVGREFIGKPNHPAYEKLPARVKRAAGGSTDNGDSSDMSAGWGGGGGMATDPLNAGGEQGLPQQGSVNSVTPLTGGYSDPGAFGGLPMRYYSPNYTPVENPNPNNMSPGLQQLRNQMYGNSRTAMNIGVQPGRLNQGVDANAAERYGIPQQFRPTYSQPPQMQGPLGPSLSPIGPPEGNAPYRLYQQYTPPTVRLADTYAAHGGRIHRQDGGGVDPLAYYFANRTQSPMLSMLLQGGGNQARAAGGGAFMRHGHPGNAPTPYLGTTHNAAMPYAPKVGHVGGLLSPVAGRTDHIPVDVPNGSYVLPADVVSGLGQGNTIHGTKIANHMFHGSFRRRPQGMGLHHMPRAAGGVTSGGPGDNVPIMAAGGEYVVPPEAVRAAGNGDLKAGHAVLDAFVKKVRSKTIDTLKKLPGPVKK